MEFFEKALDIVGYLLGILWIIVCMLVPIVAIIFIVGFPIFMIYALITEPGFRVGFVTVLLPIGLASLGGYWWSSRW